MKITKNKTNRHLPGKDFLTLSLRNESGAALIVTLLIMVVMLSLVPVAMQMTAGDVERSQDFKENKEAFFVAEAGLEHAKMLTEGSSVRAALMGPDDLVSAITSNSADDNDNGTFGAGSLFTGPDGNIYDEVAFNGHTYYIRAYDNDDGDGDLTSDNDFLVILSSVGVVDGNTTTVETMIRHITVPAAGFVTNGNLEISGDANLTGTCGSTHSNGDLSLTGGNINIAADATASGTYSGGSATIGGTAGGNAPNIPIPLLDPTDYEQYADYKLASDGKVYDSGGNFIHDASSTDWQGWNFSSPKWTQTAVGNGTTLDEVSYYVEGDVVISSDVGTLGDPWDVSFVTTGFIEVSGNPDIANHKNAADPEDIQNLFMLAGTDLKFNGNATTTIEGLMYATEQISIGGNPNITGAVMAYDSPSVEGLVSINTISGNPNITYGCGLNFPVSAGIEVVSWREL